MLVLVLAGLLEGRGFDPLKLVNGSGLAYIPLYSPSEGKHLSETLSQHDGASKHPVSSSDNADRAPPIVFQHCTLGLCSWGFLPLVYTSTSLGLEAIQR